jgi:SAM-dependent methyltransferase
MRQNGMIAASGNSKNSNAHLIQSIQDLCSSPNPESDFEKIVAEIEEQNATLNNEELGNDEEIAPDVVLTEEETANELPTLRSFAALKAVDLLVDAGITSDEETLEFLVCNRVSELWQACLNNDPAFDLDRLRAETGGAYFNEIRNRFLSQYDGATNLPIPPGYSFHAPPKLMQKLTAYRVLTERRVGNWSGVGAGKTISAILTSRVIDARLTIIIAFNSTVQGWKDAIASVYPDSIVIVKERGDIQVNPEKHTYLILNFETFQQPNSDKMARQLVDNHQIDFIVLDEIQNVKQRTPKVESKRRQVVNGLLCEASKKNPDLCVLGMSATPVINNLYEAKALLEMIKGVEFSELKTFSSIANAIAMHEKLILYGIRYRPNYKQDIETTCPEIPGQSFLPRLVEAFQGSLLDKEQVLLDAKLDTIIGALRKGTLVYTHYLTGLIEPLRQAIEKAGFSVGLFTGEEKTGLEQFCKGKVDVLIGTAPVGTGVDGLQYVCNRLIIVSLPWTSAEYEQLIGRLYRQGSSFEKVEVIIPQIVLCHKDDIWSWDKMRWHRIQWKKTLADAAVDGVIPEGELASPETMQKKANEALQAWISRVEKDGVFVFERTQLKVPLPEFETQIALRRFGDFSMMNSRFNSAYSQTTHERLKQNPEEWYLYHTLYREARQTWSEIPYEKIAKSIEKRPDWVIGDFGCGEAKLAECLPNKIFSFDHVAINENVISCDIAHTPLEDETLDVAVFSLSLMGINYPDYLKEAYRVLKFGGLLKIAEPINRWLEKQSDLLAQITNAGFLMIGNIEKSNHFIYINAIKVPN